MCRSESTGIAQAFKWDILIVMPTSVRLRSLYILVGIIFFLTLTPSDVRAEVSSCSTSVSPAQIEVNATDSFAFRVENTSDVPITWVRVTRPDETMSVNAASSGGWNASSDADGGTFSGGGSISVGGSAYFTLNITASDVAGQPGDWVVMTSDDGGSTETTCSGDSSIIVAEAGTGGEVSVGPVISDILVSNVTDSQVTISWVTDVLATTVIDYGTSESYESQSSGNASTTSHSVTIGSLTANTTYHYNVSSADSNGAVSESGDNTFVTATAGSTGTTTTGTVTTVTKYVTSATPTPIPDRVGPRITIKTKFEKIYTEPPVIEGTVSDGSSVSSLEYSLDGGINYVPVDGIKAFGKTSIPFSFTPYQLDDGSYTLVMRSVDGKGNSSMQKSASYTVDRMPPQLGATIVTFGSQVIEPVGDTVHVISGMEYVFTTSIIGGPVSMKYSVENSRGELADVTAQKNIDTGLWRAPMRFEEAGTYTVFGVAIDGAANKTVTELMQISVLPGGVIHDARNNPIENAEVTVFVLDNATQQFVVWDGKSYGQNNPIITGKSGLYGFAVPVGKYYLRVKVFGYKTVISDIFEVDRISPIAQNLQAERSFGIQIGSWIIPLFDFSETRTVIHVAAIPTGTAGVKSTGVIGKEMPFFRFPFDEKFITSLDLRGKPTLITVLNTWSPMTAPQLSVIGSLSVLNTVHTVVIVPQESTASVATFMKRGAYDVRIVADPDGTLVDPTLYRTSPMHILVDRKGIVKSVITGLVTKEKILDSIVN